MHKLKPYSLALVLAVSFALPATFAQRKLSKPKTTNTAATAATRGADLITAAQLKDYLSFIASDEMEGRDTPSRGLDTTAKFIAMSLSRWGFKTAGDDGTYFQRIALRRDRVDSGQTRVEFGGRVLNAGTEYIPVAGSGN